MEDIWRLMEDVWGLRVVTWGLREVILGPKVFSGLREVPHAVQFHHIASGCVIEAKIPQLE